MPKAETPSRPRGTTELASSDYPVALRRVMRLKGAPGCKERPVAAQSAKACATCPASSSSLIAVSISITDSSRPWSSRRDGQSSRR
jgi:hypothetical protein